MELPADLVRTLYNALVLVHNFDHPARDSVVEIYRIRPPTWPLYEVIVGIDTTHEWTRAWREGVALTGNRAVDDLVEAYELEIKRVGFFGDWVTLRAGRALNTVALSARLKEITGVRYAEPNGVGGDPPDIRARDLGTEWELTYRLGYGDCPSGCIQEHFWIFSVSTSGRVSFSGSSGDPAPPPGRTW